MYVSKKVIARTLGISSVSNSYLKELTRDEAEQRLTDLKNKVRERITEILSITATECYYLKRGQDIYNISKLKTIAVPYVMDVVPKWSIKATNITSEKLSLLNKAQKNAIIEQYMRGVDYDIYKHTTHLKYLN
jgi:glycogen synthase